MSAKNTSSEVKDNNIILVNEISDKGLRLKSALGFQIINIPFILPYVFMASLLVYNLSLGIFVCSLYMYGLFF